MPFDLSGGNARRVIALDLSSTVGVAWGELADPKPRFTSWPLYDEAGEGGRYASFENSLAAKMDEFEPQNMVLEATLSLGALLNGGTNYSAVAQQFSLRAVARMEAYRGSCAVSEIDARTVRAEVAGLPRSLNSKAAKREVIRYCRKRGMMVTNDHQGDACFVWLWHRQRMLGIAPCAGPLWREAV